MLDSNIYPHIVERVVDLAIADALGHRPGVEYTLRLVARWVADRVDSALFAHVEIDQFGSHINIEGPNRRTLPGFRLRRYTAEPIDEEDRDLDASPSPLRLLRHARVVDFRAQIYAEDGARLFPSFPRVVEVARNLWHTHGEGGVEPAACPLPCTKFVTAVSCDDGNRTMLDSEVLAPGAKTIAFTFILPTEVDVRHRSLAIEGEMEGCDEVIIRYICEEGRIEAIKIVNEDPHGLGVLHGFIEPMVARGSTLSLTLVGAEQMNQALFGYRGPFNAPKLKQHIVDRLIERGDHCAAVEAAVRVQTNDDRRREIGDEAFQLEM